jgi:hypothetical membrane protein
VNDALSPRASRAALPVLVATVFVTGWLTPGYSPWRETVSRLAAPGQRYALVVRAGFVLYGLLVVIAADRIPGAARPLVALYGCGAVVAGIFPKGGAHPLASRLHVDAVIAGELCVMAAMFVAARRPAGRDAAVVALAITAGAGLAFPFLWGSPLYGLMERIALAPAALWIRSAVAAGLQPVELGVVATEPKQVDLRRQRLFVRHRRQSRPPLRQPATYFLAHGPGGCGVRDPQQTNSEVFVKWVSE